MYEYPPILKGTEQEQLAALRDYLVRMTRSLRAAESAAETAGDGAARPAVPAAAAPQTAAAQRQEAGELRALIAKTAQRLDGALGGRLDTVQQDLEHLDAALHEDYLAVSDFGAYTVQAELTMRAAAREVLESYDYQERIQAADEALDGLSRSLTAIRGEIRRGLITDPETGERAMGIAIAQQLRFTGQTQDADGVTYYELSPGQTLGLYTASGWQFWINGSKRGWFDAADGMLHVTRLRAVDSMDLGGSWRLSSAGGFGVRCTGG